MLGHYSLYPYYTCIKSTCIKSTLCTSVCVIYSVITVKNVHACLVLVLLGHSPHYIYVVQSLHDFTLYYKPRVLIYSCIHLYTLIGLVAKINRLG